MIEVLATVLGIGLLLFIHETGHFIAARMAGVRVETFSLGFGPRLFGWKRNGCDFRVALVPIGGYVRMAGEDQTRPPLPDELGAKSVGWRFWIFSGGIIANFLFALVVFPLLFWIGVPFPAPVAGRVDPGGPAWEAGLVEGDRIQRINGRELYSYRQFAAAIALSGSDEDMVVDLEGADGEARQIGLVPVFDPSLGFRRVGVDVPFDPDMSIQVEPDSPAWEAGLRSGDRVLALNGEAVPSVFALRVLFEGAGLERAPMQLEVEREGSRVTATVVPGEGESAVQVGIRPLANMVRAARGPLEGVLQEGDELLAAGGLAVRSYIDLYAAAIRAGGMPELRIRRAGRESLVPADPSIAPAMLAAGLWLGPHPVDAEDGLRVAVSEGGPAWQAGLRLGDLLMRVNNEPVDSTAQLIPVVSASEGEPLSFVYEPAAGGELREVQVTPRASPLPVYGFNATVFQETVRSRNLLDGIKMGISEADTMVREVFLTIRRMVSGELGAENLGGIITIGTLTHKFAGAGWVPLLFFLAIISIHLGVINLLPIPALDGGHLFFLLIEKIRGRPLGEKAQIWFNVVGFVAVLSLIVFVTWMDIRRLIE